MYTATFVNVVNGDTATCQCCRHVHSYCSSWCVYTAILVNVVDCVHSYCVNVVVGACTQQALFHIEKVGGGGGGAIE